MRFHGQFAEGKSETRTHCTAGLARLHHGFAEQRIAVAKRYAAAKSSARGARPALIANGASAQFFQCTEYRHWAKLE